MKIKGIENISVKVITALLAVMMLPIVVLSFPRRYENILMTMEKVYLLRDNPIAVFLLTYSLGLKESAMSCYRVYSDSLLLQKNVKTYLERAK